MSKMTLKLNFLIAPLLLLGGPWSWSTPRTANSRQSTTSSYGYCSANGSGSYRTLEAWRISGNGLSRYQVLVSERERTTGAFVSKPYSFDSLNCSLNGDVKTFSLLCAGIGFDGKNGMLVVNNTPSQVEVYWVQGGILANGSVVSETGGRTFKMISSKVHECQFKLDMFDSNPLKEESEEPVQSGDATDRSESPSPGVIRIEPNPAYHRSEVSDRQATSPTTQETGALQESNETTPKQIETPPDANPNTPENQLPPCTKMGSGVNCVLRAKPRVDDRIERRDSKERPLLLPIYKLIDKYL